MNVWTSSNKRSLFPCRNEVSERYPYLPREESHSDNSLPRRGCRIALYTYNCIAFEGKGLREKRRIRNICSGCSTTWPGKMYPSARGTRPGWGGVVPGAHRGARCCSIGTRLRAGNAATDAIRRKNHNSSSGVRTRPGPNEGVLASSSWIRCDSLARVPSSDVPASSSRRSG
jgi:hypothetical protein